MLRLQSSKKQCSEIDKVETIPMNELFNFSEEVRHSHITENFMVSDCFQVLGKKTRDEHSGY
jgi:hypothetical protein